MSESRLRERSAEKPFQVEAGRGGREGGGRLSSQWSHFALIQFCIVFYSEVVRFLSENWPLFVYLLFVCFFLQGCSAANRPQYANLLSSNNRHSATYSAQCCLLNINQLAGDILHKRLQLPFPPGGSDETASLRCWSGRCEMDPGRWRRQVSIAAAPVQQAKR